MADFSVRIRGADRIVRALGSGLLEAGLRPGFQKAGVIVEAAWKDNAHVVTRKYQGSIQSDVEGSGADIAARIGPRPGYGQPRRYTKSQTRHWKRPRDGVNKGDPTTYAQFEDRRHPAAEPALADNVNRIAEVIADSFDAAMKRRV